MASNFVFIWFTFLLAMNTARCWPARKSIRMHGMPNFKALSCGGAATGSGGFGPDIRRSPVKLSNGFYC